MHLKLKNNGLQFLIKHCEITGGEFCPVIQTINQSVTRI